MSGKFNFFQDAGGRMDLVPAFNPVDLQTAANSGDRIKVTEYGKVVVVLQKAIGTDNDDPVISLQQATAATGGSTKALNITEYYTRLGADITTVGAWTKVTQASGATLTITDSAQKAGMIAIEVDPATMDIDGGYPYLALNVADTGGNAQLGSGFYILGDKRYEGFTTDVTV